jgi:ATP-dependent exoDNAse (exonuclease V) beta subunit
LHHQRLCPPASASPAAPTAPPAVPVTASVPPGLQPLTTRAAITRGRVTDLVVASRSGRPRSDEGPTLDADLVVGRAVHRLLARGGGVESDAVLRARVLADLAPDERLVIADTAELARDVVAIVRHVWEDATLRDVMASPATRYEVPIVFRQDDAEGVRLFRGSIDCLATDGGGWQVLEFKTGRPHPSHDRQLALYVDAVRAMTGGPVRGRLVYATRAALSAPRTAPVATRLPFDDD